MSTEDVREIRVDRGLVVSIAWNSNGWRGQSDTPTDWTRSNFEDVRDRGSAHEWWNFYVDHPHNEDGFAYGYFHPSGSSKPSITSAERLAVFFASKEPPDGGTYIVGAYLAAEFSPGGWPGIRQRGEGDISSESNLRCPKDQVWVGEPKRILRLDARRHLRGKAIGRRNFTYIGSSQIHSLLGDLLDAQRAWMEGLARRVKVVGE